MAFKSTSSSSLAFASLASKGVKTTKSKLIKEPESEAKRAPSAYNLFVKASIPSLKEQSPPGSKNLMSQAASAWSALSPERRKAYEAESQALKSALVRKDEGKAKEDKRPLTHYTLFVQQRYPAVAAKNPTLKAKEIFAFVAGEWKAMPEADKKDRKSAADALRKAYAAKHP